MFEVTAACFSRKSIAGVEKRDYVILDPRYMVFGADGIFEGNESLDFGADLTLVPAPNWFKDALERWG